MSSYRYDALKDELYTLSKLQFHSGKSYEQLEPEIKAIAYRHWQNAGAPEGHELDFWLQAEQELLYKIIEEG